jgi:hypothetical protein
MTAMFCSDCRPVCHFDHPLSWSTYSQKPDVSRHRDPRTQAGCCWNSQQRPGSLLRTGFWAYSASRSKGTGRSFPGVKQAGREADHSPPSKVVLKSSYASTATCAIMTWAGTALLYSQRTRQVAALYVSAYIYMGTDFVILCTAANVQR